MVTHDEIVKLSDTETVSVHYLVDLTDEANLAEWVDDTRIWLQAFPLGNYKHPRHGKIHVDEARVQHYTEQVNTGIRGQDLDINYDHTVGKAAGWIEKAANRGKDGLWLLVNLTEAAAKSVKSREYRYFSPEFVNLWEHPLSKIVFNDVLLGGALTNRPFLKGIQPLTLSEEGSSMDRELLEKLAKKLGITFTDKTSDDDLLKLVNDASEEDNSTEDEVEEEETEEEAEEATSEEDKELATLAEQHPEIAKLLSDNKALADRMEKIESVANRNHIRVKLSELGDDHTKYSPAVTKALGDLMLKLDPAAADLVYKFAESVLTGDDAIIKLGETGGKTDPIDLGGKSATEVWDAEIAKLTSGDNAMTYGDAAVHLSETNSELWQAYENESIGGNV